MGDAYRSGKVENPGENSLMNDSKTLKDREGTYAITVDLSSPKPIYRQIVDSVVMNIATGVMGQGERLPSSRQLAYMLGVNYHTVNQAYGNLEKEGYVYFDRRKRVIVKEIPRLKDIDIGPYWKEKVRILLSEALSRGYKPPDIFLEIEKILSQIMEKSEK